MLNIIDEFTREGRRSAALSRLPEKPQLAGAHPADALQFALERIVPAPH